MPFTHSLMAPQSQTSMSAVSIGKSAPLLKWISALRSSYAFTRLTGSIPSAYVACAAQMMQYFLPGFSVALCRSQRGRWLTFLGASCRFAREFCSRSFLDWERVCDLIDYNYLISETLNSPHNIFDFSRSYQIEISLILSVICH